VYVAVSVAPAARVVGVTATEIGTASATSALSVCVVSPLEMHARTRRNSWFASVHVSVTGSPVVAAAVHRKAAPDPAAVTVVSVAAPPHAVVPRPAVVADRKHRCTDVPAVQPVYVAVSVAPAARVVGVTATEMAARVSPTWSLSVCAVSPLAMHARTRTNSSVGLVHVSALAAPVAAASVHTTFAPEAPVVTEFAAPAAAHATLARFAAVPDRKQRCSDVPVVQPVYVAVSVAPAARVVGVTATEMGRASETSALSV
jgi:hypothetical protein